MLVDTYNTIKSGVPNFCLVALGMNELGHKAKGFRLDSGDLAKLSLEARDVLKDISERSKVDLTKSIIIASDDIQEKKLKKF